MRVYAPAIALLVFTSAAFAKPPGNAVKDSARKPSPVVSPAVESNAEAALARWLALAPSGPDAPSLPFAPLMCAASGKRIVAFDPALPADATALTKIGSALDILLPRMNQPESPARTALVAGGPDAVTIAFETELRTLLAAAPLTPDAKPNEHSYPKLTYADVGTSKMYYLAVSLCPTGGDPAADSLRIRPDLAAQRITADGCCLLVAIEHNGKPGKDIAFLNWQIVDLAKTRWRFAPSFVTGGSDAHSPGAVLTDGRKGRD